MPWPWYLCQVCLDYAASQAAGTAVFRWPFPQLSAFENGWWLDRMQWVWRAVEVFRLDPDNNDELPAEEEQWYREYLKRRVDAGF